MSEDISSKVKKIVADHLGIDEAKVNEDQVLQMIWELIAQIQLNQ